MDQSTQLKQLLVNSISKMEKSKYNSHRETNMDIIGDVWGFLQLMSNYIYLCE